MKTVLLFLKDLGLKNKFDFDITLARGLSYYTGTIIEVKALEAAMGSICGGGRYDDLTGIFGLPGMSGVGISFGADRIYDVMTELNLFPEAIQAATRVLFVNFGPEEEKYCLKLLANLRQAAIPSEIYPESSKLKKQMEYANRKNIPFVILTGRDEMESGLLTLKDMQSGEQKSCSLEEIIKTLTW
jgi:histidyl-tRNA synthetase